MAQQLVHDCGNRFRPVANRERNNASVLLRRIPEGISEVSVQEQTYRADLLGLSDYSGILDIRAKTVGESNDLVSF
jgi:hypothetical protein